MAFQPATSAHIAELLLGSVRDFALIMLDPEGRIASWSEGAKNITGYDESAMLGEPLSALFTQDWDDARLNATPLQGREEIECVLQRSDKTSMWVNIILAPLEDAAAQRVGYSLLIRDFSRRKQAESHLEKTLKELSDMKYALDESAIVAITDRHGIITYVNDTFCRISQYSREELLGQTHRIINAGHHPDVFFREMWQTISQGHIWRAEVKNKAKDGSDYWVDTTIVPFLDASGQPYQYIAIRHEITDRKRVELEIRHLNEEMELRIQQRTAELATTNLQLSQTLEELQKSEKLRSTFISALTHDLRTPLVAQERALEILSAARNNLPEKMTALVERLAGSNAGLLQMVNMLLETYQYEAGKINLLWESVDINALVQTCFAEIHVLAESRGIHLVNVLSETLPKVPGDPHHLKRIFINLLGNALENIPSGSTIQISGNEEADRILIAVGDNGPGIAPEMLPHLFERYYIGEHTRKKIGTGLGLYICKMIMALHHGDITVTSTPPTGTTFTLELLKHPKESQHD